MSSEPIRLDIRSDGRISTLDVKDVLVLHNVDFGPEQDTLMAQLAELTGALIVHLPEDGSIESLDESEMRTHGWIRRDPSLTLTPCDCGAHYRQLVQPESL